MNRHTMIPANCHDIFMEHIMAYFDDDFVSKQQNNMEKYK